MLLVCGEENSESAFNGIISTYKLILSNQKWTDRGQLVVPGVLNKGDILSTDYLICAEKMGSNI
ncbi:MULTISPECIES: hypothetical protein [Clostridium]|uniref:Uncharacterized protein n=2 Tax=Clostridium TaxID=1485 RepID=A0ABX2TRE3_CLOLD|nr:MULTISPECIES: hypothetical protein [Clostridium]AGY74748.1 hypothetical protein CAETHG_0519 [Clostridium autoethanogenum DSM 10061]OAA85483.1 hypothetical protein WX45_00448 [Clostridium ljungdahlii DSM 13528]OVY51683.1 hypothetical protein WX72_01816 [Clostridium autoethanogenum]